MQSTRSEMVRFPFVHHFPVAEVGKEATTIRIDYCDASCRYFQNVHLPVQFLNIASLSIRCLRAAYAFILSSEMFACG